jgi:hypothetical protein
MEWIKTRGGEGKREREDREIGEREGGNRKEEGDNIHPSPSWLGDG